MCEDCVQQVEEEEEYQDLLLCYICCKPVREENMMSLKNGGLIHEGCYEGGDG